MKKNILYIHNTDPNSDSANLVQVVNMCMAFADLANSVSLFLPLMKSDRKNKSIITNKIIKQFELSEISNISINFFFVPNCLNRLSKNINWIYAVKAIDKSKYDIAIVRHPLYALVCRLLQIPFIFELHNNKLHLGSVFLNKLYGGILHKLYDSEFFVKLVPISQALADLYVIKGFSSNKMEVHHDGFNSKVFKEERDKSVERTKLIIPNDRIIITYTGNLQPDRNIKIIIDAALSFPDVLFYIVGGPENYKNELKEYAFSVSCDNIIFTGNVAHNLVSSYLFASDILLGIWSNKVPTINYCSPLKVFEYMASGRLIVAQGFPTIKEVLNESNSILVEPDDLESLVFGIKNAISIVNISKLSNLARQEAFKKYSWNKRAANMMNL